MIRNQSPCEASCRCLDEDSLQPGNKIIPVQVIGEDFLAFDTATNYMVERTCSINSSLARHIVSSFCPCNLYTSGRPPSSSYRRFCHILRTKAACQSAISHLLGEPWERSQLRQLTYPNRRNQASQTAPRFPFLCILNTKSLMNASLFYTRKSTKSIEISQG